MTRAKSCREPIGPTWSNTTWARCWSLPCSMRSSRCFGGRLRGTSDWGRTVQGCCRLTSYQPTCRQCSPTRRALSPVSSCRFAFGPSTTAHQSTCGSGNTCVRSSRLTIASSLTIRGGIARHGPRRSAATGSTRLTYERWPRTNCGGSLPTEVGRLVSAHLEQFGLMHPRRARSGMSSPRTYATRSGPPGNASSRWGREGSSTAGTLTKPGGTCFDFFTAGVSGSTARRA